MRIGKNMTRDDVEYTLNDMIKLTYHIDEVARKYFTIKGIKKWGSVRYSDLIEFPTHIIFDYVDSYDSYYNEQYEMPIKYLWEDDWEEELKAKVAAEQEKKKLAEITSKKYEIQRTEALLERLKKDTLT